MLLNAAAKATIILGVHRAKVMEKDLTAVGLVDLSGQGTEAHQEIRNLTLDFS